MLNRDKPRFALTGSETRSMLVLGGLLLVGLIIVQVKRYQEKDLNSIVIKGAEELTELPVENNSGEPSLKIPDDEIESPGEALNRSQIAYLDEESEEALKPPLVRINDKIDLNNCTVSELETLPGIGPIIAGRIIEYRQQFGNFQSLEDLLLVKGIGTKRLEKIAPLVIVKNSGD